MFTTVAIDIFRSIFGKSFSELPFIILGNFFASIIYILIAFGFVFLIIRLRIIKNKRSSLKEDQKDILEDFINNYLFEEDYKRVTRVVNFKREHLKTNLKKRLTIKEIVSFHENLKGETAEDLEVLFLKLNLESIVINDLEKGKWYEKARALYVLSELQISLPEENIYPYLNHKKRDLRQEAQLYFVRLAKENPIAFLEKLQQPLTKWEQIYIEDALKKEYKGEIPNFAAWRFHHLDSVVQFSIKMIARFNQYENIDKIVPFISHHSEIVRIETIRTLYALEHYDVLLHIIPRFTKETFNVKKEIICAIKELGNLSHLHQLKSQIKKSELNLKLDYYLAEKHFLPGQIESIYLKYEQEKGNLQEA
ncbi:hypothetical protein ACG2LH_08605 [Zhouia sp. PK063]|uniref:hypothetical protein n=1 Tax=Zhouia sp. PK063 TaxID=3373602 RepID=UPI00379DB682